MYLAVLFDEHDQLLAAAPACDQQPMGDRYWQEIYPQPLPRNLGQTAVLDVVSHELVTKLLALANFPETLGSCRALWAAYEDGSRTRANAA